MPYMHLKKFICQSLSGCHFIPEIIAKLTIIPLRFIQTFDLMTLIMAVADNCFCDILLDFQ